MPDLAPPKGGLFSQFGQPGLAAPFNFEDRLRDGYDDSEEERFEMRCPICTSPTSGFEDFCPACGFDMKNSPGRLDQ
jgi:hypothetical protein